MEEILKTGDQAIYALSFPPALISVRLGTLSGTAKFNVNKAVACVEGDEDSATVLGCSYTSGSYTTPGVGTLSITKLNADQLSLKTKSVGKPIMLRGTTFLAQFDVTAPAQMPTAGGPVPDPTSQYKSQGKFETTNTTVKDNG